jgi:hypothetical protein
VHLRERAEANLERHLKQNPYPGRGLVIGRAGGGEAWLLVYWIMGRSASSQSRRFVAEGGVLRTEPTDPERLERPELTIYEAMLDLPGQHLVTNGDQTRTLRDVVSRGGSFEDALAAREREPDAPHYTPRIAGLLDLRSDPRLALGILKASAVDPAHTDRFAYRPAPPPPGLGLTRSTPATGWRSPSRRCPGTGSSAPSRCAIDTPETVAGPRLTHRGNATRQPR